MDSETIDRQDTDTGQIKKETSQSSPGWEVALRDHLADTETLYSILAKWDQVLFQLSRNNKCMTKMPTNEFTNGNEDNGGNVISCCA